MKRLTMLLMALIMFGFLHHHKRPLACDASAVQQFLSAEQHSLDTYRDGSFQQRLEQGDIDRIQTEIDELSQSPCDAALPEKIDAEIHGLYLWDKALQRAYWI